MLADDVAKSKTTTDEMNNQRQRTHKVKSSNSESKSYGQSEMRDGGAQAQKLPRIVIHKPKRRLSKVPMKLYAKAKIYLKSNT